MSSHSRFSTLGLPCILLMLAMLNLTLIVAGLKELVLDDLGGTAKHASLFFSLEMLAYILFAPVWGVLSDRLGTRKPFVVLGFAGSALAYAGYVFVGSIEALLTLRFFQGVLSVMGWSVLMAWVTDHASPERRGRVAGFMGASLTLGVSLGAPIGGYVARDLGSRAPLWAAAALFAVAAVLALGIPAPDSLRPSPKLRFGRLLRRRPRLLVPFSFYFVDRFTVGILVVLFPLYLGVLGSEDPAVRGRLLAYFLLPFSLLQPFTGRLTERVGAFWPLLLGSLAYGGLLSFVGLSDLAMLRFLMVVMGLTAAVMFPPTIALTIRWSGDDERGSALGAFNVAGSLGFAIGPLVGAWLLDRGGYPLSFAVAGGLEIALGGLGLLWWLSRRFRSRG